MTNYELFVKGLESMIDLSDIEEVVRVLRDESDALESRLSKTVMAGTFENILNRFKTDKKCPKCGKILYLSDLAEYDYLCTDCQENYFECEIR